MKYTAVVVASGSGVRANLGYNKTFYMMKNGKTVLENASSLFINDDDCEKIIIVTNKEYFNDVFKNNKVELVEGGIERKDSVLNGLNKVESDYVMIHDGARPFLDIDSLMELKKEVVDKNAVILASKVVETVKIVKDNYVEKSVDRNTVYLAQTPQAFKTSLIKESFCECADTKFTDEASIIESLGKKVYVVTNKHNNKKLTSEEDFINI